MGRRVFVVLLVVATLGVVATVAGASHGGFHATLMGYDEVPAVSSTGTGEFGATLTMTREGPAIRYRLDYSGLEGVAMASHIHFGQEDVNGGIVAFLCGGDGTPACPPSGSVSGLIHADDIIGPAGQGIAAGEFDESVAAMEAGMSYVNVHTDKHPGGEIRGQVVPD
jgi:hypothetical protein